jgi:hypothetical protein
MIETLLDTTITADAVTKRWLGERMASALDTRANPVGNLLEDETNSVGKFHIADVLIQQGPDNMYGLLPLDPEPEIIDYGIAHKNCALHSIQKRIGTPSAASFLDHLSLWGMSPFLEAVHYGRLGACRILLASGAQTCQQTSCYQALVLIGLCRGA